MREAFTQEVLHLCLQYLYLSRGNVVLSSEIYRVFYQLDESPWPVLVWIQFVQILCIPKEMSQTDLMILNIHLEVALVSVCHKCRIGKSLWKLGIYGLLTSRFWLEHVCKQVVLEYPVPMQMLSYRSTRFISSYDWCCFQPLRIFIIVNITKKYNSKIHICP